MTVDLRKLIQRLVLVALVLTPLFSAGEVIGLLQGVVHSQTTALTPVYIKALKDLLLVCTAVLSVLAICRLGTTNVLAVPAVVFLIYLLAISLRALTVDLRLVISGIRWILPVLLGFLLIQFVDEGFLRRMARVICGLFFLHFALQVLQLFFMSAWYGTTVFGLAARVPGMFFIPSTGGFFSLMCLFFAAFYERPGWVRNAVFLLVPVSVVLTQSGTSLVVLVLFVALLFLGARRALYGFPFLVPVVLAGALLVLPVLVDRGADYVAVSGGTRLDILFDLLLHGQWLPSTFGYATNTAVGFARGLDAGGGIGTAAMIVDSTYASIIGNLGFLGVVGLCIAGCAWLLVIVRNQRTDLYAFSLIFVLFGATTSVTEAFPMNLLFAVLLAWFLGCSLGPEPGVSAVVAAPEPSVRGVD